MLAVGSEGTPQLFQSAFGEQVLIQFANKWKEAVGVVHHGGGIAVANTETIVRNGIARKNSNPHAVVFVACRVLGVSGHYGHLISEVTNGADSHDPIFGVTA